MSSFSAVITQYDKAITKQFTRMARQKRDFLTKNEQAGVAYYNLALTQIKALEAQGG